MLLPRPARDFVKENADKILIAENDAYVPPFSIPRPLETVKTVLENTEKDYSLTVLSQARGSVGTFYIRGKGSTTSREDLVVFRADNPVVIFTGLGLTGRPEVYEVKAIRQSDFCSAASDCLFVELSRREYRVAMF
jgi:hypothetical protein